MNNSTLQAFRDIAASMQSESQDWQWIGPHMSQRMFGITRTRAEAYATRHGGDARPMVAHPATEDYRLPDGRVVQIDADVARGAATVTFELAPVAGSSRGRIVLAVRVDGGRQ